LRGELKLQGNYSPVVKVTDLENALEKIQEAKAWVKGAILLILHNLLCPTNSSLVSLQYAHILEDLAGISSYNWCSHVLEHVREESQARNQLHGENGQGQPVSDGDIQAAITS
ncbi:hypothetical protein Leryth_022396, partial [Lithospermum erythrorhizon]